MRGDLGEVSWEMVDRSSFWTCMVCGKKFAVRVDGCDEPDCEGRATPGLIFEPTPPMPFEQRLAVLAEWGLLLGKDTRGGRGNN
jgi:hypothetical protein